MKDSTFEPTQPQPTEKPKEPSAYERKMQNMLEASRGRIIAFAEDTSLSFRAGKGFFFQPETGVITHDASWFEKRGFEPEAILFAIFHELTHFRDYRQDTKYSDRLFKENFAKAKVLGKQIFDKWAATEGISAEVLDSFKQEKRMSKKFPEMKLNQAELAAFKMYHFFYNIYNTYIILYFLFFI